MLNESATAPRYLFFLTTASTSERGHDFHSQEMGSSSPKGDLQSSGSGFLQPAFLSRVLAFLPKLEKEGAM